MKLNFRETGAGPPVVVAHGLFGSASNWQSIARPLADRFRLLLVDLRNHGESPHSEVMDYPAMAGDLADLIDCECGKSASLIGHSMGGKAAMTLALSNPERVQRLAVIDTAPVNYLSGFRRYTEALAAIPLPALTSRRDAEAHLVEAVPDAGVRAFLLHNLRRTDGGWEWRINLPVIAAALETLSGFPDFGQRRYPGAALFLGGGLSEYLSPERFRAALEWFPEARLEMIAEAGHWLHAERPAEVVKALSAFLEE